MAVTPVSLDEVRGAIAALRGAGIDPSVRRIRAQLGHRGSMDRILLLRRQALGEAPPEPEHPPASLLQAAQQLMPDVWRHATAEARVAVAEELRRAGEDAGRARTEAAEAAALLAEQTARAETERSERERLAAVVAGQTEAIAALRAELATTNDRLAALPELRAAITGTAAGWKELLDEQERRFAIERERMHARQGELTAQSRRDGEALSAAATELLAAQRAAAEQSARIATLQAQAAQAADALGGMRARLAAAEAALEVERLRSADALRARQAAEAAASTTAQRALALEQRMDDLVLALQRLDRRHGEALEHQIADRDAVIAACTTPLAELRGEIAILATRLPQPPAA